MSLIRKNAKIIGESIPLDPISTIKVELSKSADDCFAQAALKKCNKKYPIFTTLDDIEAFSNEYCMIYSPGHETIKSTIALVEYLIIKLFKLKYDFEPDSFISGCLLVQNKFGAIEATSFIGFHWSTIKCRRLAQTLDECWFHYKSDHYRPFRRTYYGKIPFQVVLSVPTLYFYSGFNDEGFRWDELVAVVKAIETKFDTERSFNHSLHASLNCNLELTK